MLANLKHLVGIDEAGRGPLAGPVAVGVVCLPASSAGLPAVALAEAGLGAGEVSDEILAIFGKKGVRDSKKLSEKRREEDAEGEGCGSGNKNFDDTPRNHSEATPAKCASVALTSADPSVKRAVSDEPRTTTAMG